MIIRTAPGRRCLRSRLTWMAAVVGGAVAAMGVLPGAEQSSLAAGPTASATPTAPAGTGSPATNPPFPPASDDCGTPIPAANEPGEAYLAGYSNIAKLGGSALLGVQNQQTTGHALIQLETELAGCASINFGGGTVGAGDELLSTAVLDDVNGLPQLPSATATFLAFGVVPTTVTFQLVEPSGTGIQIVTQAQVQPPFGQHSIMTTELSIRVLDADVDGTPLDVGPQCMSATPMTVSLSGDAPAYTVSTGGPLTGTATIPPFSGCGADGELDALFTGTVSGPGNDMKLNQGVPCTYPPAPQTPVNCDPIDRPAPER